MATLKYLNRLMLVYVVIVTARSVGNSTLPDTRPMKIEGGRRKAKPGRAPPGRSQHWQPQILAFYLSLGNKCNHKMKQWLRAVFGKQERLVTRIPPDPDVELQSIWILNEGPNDDKGQQCLTWWRNQDQEYRDKCSIVAIAGHAGSRMDVGETAFRFDRQPDEFYMSHGTGCADTAQQLNRLIHAGLTSKLLPISTSKTQIALVSQEACIMLWRTWQKNGFHRVCLRHPLPQSQLHQCVRSGF